MTKDDPRERATRLAQRKPGASAAADSTSEPRAAKAMAPRTKAVRMTTDVPPQTHRALTRIAADIAERAGLTRANFTDILRALLAELEASPELQARVSDRLAAQALSSSADQ